jgi:ABC-type transport system involved in multi-copper enzyme maturation permease subunit
MGLGNVAAVFLFEWKRSLTAARIAWWVVLTVFPVLIVTLVRSVAIEPLPREPWILLLFALTPMVVSMLGTFLWATPAVSAELEGRSWVYLATRPGGNTAVLLGKYLAAVTWVLPAALLGLAMAVALVPLDDAWQIGLIIARITCLSCPAYAAVYLLIGALFPKRAMALAVAYTLLFEFVISMIPAMINTLTVQVRSRTLLIEWTDVSLGEVRDGPMAVLGEPPAWRHVLILVAYTATLLIVAIVRVRQSEYSAAEAADV